MTFAGGIFPENTRLAISDSENKSHIRFFPAFLSGKHLCVKAHIFKKRRLPNSEKKREREREKKKVLAAHIIVDSTCDNLTDSAGLRLTTHAAQVSRRKNPQAVFQEKSQ